MTTIINPGSHHTGGSYEVATRRALYVMKAMEEAGIADVVLLDGAETCDCGWRFTFRHKITGKECHYETHGLVEIDERHSDRGFLFPPRDYWEGSSFGNPKAEDFLTDGFRVVQRIEPISDGEEREGEAA